MGVLFLCVFTYANVECLKVNWRKCQDWGFETQPTILPQYSCAPVSTDSVFAVYCGLKKKMLKITEINVS
jgi:hypothetical protein